MLRSHTRKGTQRSHFTSNMAKWLEVDCLLCCLANLLILYLYLYLSSRFGSLNFESPASVSEREIV